MNMPSVTQEYSTTENTKNLSNCNWQFITPIRHYLLMTWNNRIVWSEGMFLQPQHFQQHDRYLWHRETLRARALNAFAWGFTKLIIDENALAIGKIGIIEAEGLLPDGTTFQIPNEDAAPILLDLSTDTRDEVVYLCLHITRPGVIDSDSENPSTNIPVRHRASEVVISDHNASESRTAPVQIGRLNFMLRTRVDRADESLACMGVVKVTERRSDGKVVLDRGFIPPTLHVNSSLNLRSFVREVGGLMAQRGIALSSRLAQPGYRGVSDVTDFLMLQVINQYESFVTHLESIQALHPERLYSELLQIAGGLATFRESRRPPKFPAYDHNDLQACFNAVMNDIRLSLSMVMEQNAFQIELQERKYGIRVSIIEDVNLLRTATFVLAVNAQMPQDALRARFPTQLKVGPVDKIRELVNLHLPGVTVSPMPVAPRQLPYHAGFTYFEMNTRGNEFWRQLESNGGGLAMHVAGEFPGLEMEFWAIRRLD